MREPGHRLCPAELSGTRAPPLREATLCGLRGANLSYDHHGCLIDRVQQAHRFCVCCIAELTTDGGSLRLMDGAA